MDTSDRSDRTLPVHASAALPALPLRGSWDEGAEGMIATPPKTFTIKVILRAARRHWWQILGLWMVGSVIIVPLLYYKVKPTYDAVAWLRIEPTNRSLIAQVYDANSAGGAYLETQVQLITSPDVLGRALEDPKYELGRLPRYRTSLDASDELRKNLRVTIIPKTTLIQIAVTSESPRESADVVNAVLESYRYKSDKWTDEETRVETLRLTELKTEYEAQVEKLREALTKFIKRSNVTDINLEAEKDKISVNQYRDFNRQLEILQNERMKAQSKLAYLELTAKHEGGGQLDDTAMDGAQDQFVKEPEATFNASPPRSSRRQKTCRKSSGSPSQSAIHASQR